MIYLDNAATTYPKPECVYEALDYANRNYAFNAGRGHYDASKRVFQMIEETRSLVGELVHVNGDCVSFESSATEALNIIINGLDLKNGDNVFISPFEHNAIIRPLYNLKEKVGINIYIIPFDKNTWDVDVPSMKNLFALHKPKAVFLSHISNVTGFILPYEKVFKTAKTYGAINVLDCAQSFGIVNPIIDYADFIVFAGHKSLYASFGVAGFLNVSNFKLDVVKSGGTGSDSLNHYMPENGHERYEAGSVNSVAIAGLNASLHWLHDNNPSHNEAILTKYLIKQIKSIEKIKVFLPNDTSKVIGIISFDILGYSPADVGTILSDEYNICVRTGYHCSPFVHKFIGSEDLLGTVRVSLGAFTKKDEIDKLMQALRSF